MKKEKKAESTVSIFIGIGLFVVIGIALVMTIMSGNVTTNNFLNKFSESVQIIFQSILVPLFKAILGLESATSPQNQILMVLAFFLLAIIIINTLDAINFFGVGTTKANLTNFFVGIIVSIIGVRFMPSDLWSSLTAPSSAFVAAMILGIPFLAMLFVTMKIDRRHLWLSKIMWIIFLVFNFYLLMRLSADNYIRGVYFIMIVLCGLMLYFDSTVRRFFNIEIEKYETEEMLSNIDLVKRRKIREELEEIEKIIADPNSPKEDVIQAKKRRDALMGILVEASKNK